MLTKTVAISDTFSCADTDDSGSESDHDNHFTFSTAARTHHHHHSKHKMLATKPLERTAPMLIPQPSRSRRRGRTQEQPAYFVNEFETESLVAQRQNRFNTDCHGSASSSLSMSSSCTMSTMSYSSDDSTSDEDVDEDDPALYQNLAYFRSQHSELQKHKQRGARSRSSSPQSHSSSSSTCASDEDTDIFDMEL